MVVNIVNTYLAFQVDPAEYTGKKVLGIPPCYQERKGRKLAKGSIAQ